MLSNTYLKQKHFVITPVLLVCFTTLLSLTACHQGPQLVEDNEPITPPSKMAPLATSLEGTSATTSTLPAAGQSTTAMPLSAPPSPLTTLPPSAEPIAQTANPSGVNAPTASTATTGQVQPAQSAQPVNVQESVTTSTSGQEKTKKQSKTTAAKSKTALTPIMPAGPGAQKTATPSSDMAKPHTQPANLAEPGLPSLTAPEAPKSPEPPAQPSVSEPKSDSGTTAPPLHLSPAPKP